MMRKLGITFTIAFVLNFIWEHLHSVLYLSYKGGEITDFILLRAALFDAAVITLFTWFFVVATPSFLKGRARTGIVFILSLLIFAFILETWALGTGQWMYRDSMPIIPFLKTGLTPTVQLALLGNIAFHIANKPLFSSK